MTKKVGGIASGIVLLAAALISAPTKPGYVELSDGRGGTNVESVVFAPEMRFDKARSLKAFQETLYPVLRANCSGCHSTENKTGSGAQAPLHADVNPQLAHEYALTRVNFRDLTNSKLVVRMAIDRHNCFDKNCGLAAQTMLAAITAWRDKISDMIPEVPRGLPVTEKVTEDQILAWIAADNRYGCTSYAISISKRTAILFAVNCVAEKLTPRRWAAGSAGRIEATSNCGRGSAPVGGGCPKAVHASSGIAMLRTPPIITPTLLK